MTKTKQELKITETPVSKRQEAVSLAKIADQMIASKGRVNTLGAQVSMMAFTSKTDGTDFSYARLKETLTAGQLAIVKRPASKGTTLFAWLEVNKLTIPATETMEAYEVTIDSILDGTHNISTAVDALGKVKKALKERFKRASETVVEEIEAYLEGDQVLDDHKNIPANDLASLLAAEGGLDEAREKGRAVMALKAKNYEAENREKVILDAIGYLEAAGYTVTKA
jgi:hypothetical protein